MVTYDLRNDPQKTYRTWHAKTVAKRDKYTGKLTIEGVEVEFDPALYMYVEKVK